MWNKVSEKELPYGKEVIAFNEKWIDKDRNPNGIHAYACVIRSISIRKRYMGT